MINLPQKRACLAVLMAFLALAAVFAGFVFAHLDHDCSGEHCAACGEIQTARHLLEALVRTGLIVLAAGFVYARAAGRLNFRAQVFFFPHTLVLLKTRLNP
jgi:hypothetical protein